MGSGERECLLHYNFISEDLFGTYCQSLVYKEHILCNSFSRFWSVLPLMLLISIPSTPVYISSLDKCSKSTVWPIFSYNQHHHHNHIFLSHLYLCFTSLCALLLIRFRFTVCSLPLVSLVLILII